MAPARKTKETLQVATESFFAAWCSACYDAMQANARACQAFLFTHTLRSAQQMHKPQRLVLFENWVCQQAHPHGSKRPRDSPLKGRAPVAHCSLNPIMRNPKDNKWALANRMLLVTWAARPCLLNRGHKQAAKVAVNINGSWPQVICHAPFAWRPAMMLGNCSCLGCGLVWAVYRREVAQL